MLEFSHKRVNNLDLQMALMLSQNISNMFRNLRHKAQDLSLLHFEIEDENEYRIVTIYLIGKHLE